MKRLLLSLIVAGGLALMAAPQARAGTPGPCGKSYAFIINGADPSVVAADGSATLPGAITQAVGVGSITFAAGTTSGCTATGEIIYNAGDVQTNPIGEFFGPSYCYSGISGFNGAPCFDGNATGADSSNITLYPAAPTGHSLCQALGITPGLTQLSPPAVSPLGGTFRPEWAARLWLEKRSRTSSTLAIREMALRLRPSRCRSNL